MAYIQEQINPALHSVLPPLVGRQGNRGIKTMDQEENKSKDTLLISEQAQHPQCCALLIRSGIRPTRSHQQSIYILYHHFQPPSSFTQMNLNIKFGILTTFWLAVWIKKIEKGRNWPRAPLLYNFIKWKTRAESRLVPFKVQETFPLNCGQIGCESKEWSKVLGGQGRM